MGSIIASHININTIPNMHQPDDKINHGSSVSLNVNHEISGFVEPNRINFGWHDAL